MTDTYKTGSRHTRHTAVTQPSHPSHPSHRRHCRRFINGIRPTCRAVTKRTGTDSFPDLSFASRSSDTTATRHCVAGVPVATCLRIRVLTYSLFAAYIDRCIVFLEATRFSLSLFLSLSLSLRVWVRLSVMRAFS